MERRSRRSRFYAAMFFARMFFKDPKMLGSLVPSSPYLTEHLMDAVDWQRARIVVEYGPGVGTLTTEILHRLLPDARLVAIESNREFVTYLKDNFLDPRLHIVHGSAAQVSEVLARMSMGPADYIISGIPYSTMPASERDAVIRRSWSALSPGGAFLAYQFTAAVLPSLREMFGFVRQEFELRNILPARIFYCVRA